ncbi:hypothetical protein NYE80_33480 [Paenibacillus sp. FSL H7-0357]|uniref:hypothetical protein n=1 Tax=Paenibacillus sp. FSL H7-0357 TaxID=1536774 RepID=UPI000B2700CC
MLLIQLAIPQGYELDYSIIGYAPPDFWLKQIQKTKSVLNPRALLGETAESKDKKRDRAWKLQKNEVAFTRKSGISESRYPISNYRLLGNGKGGFKFTVST